MKPNESQKEFCENLNAVIEDCITTWITSNDINSPSHYTLIEESVELAINFTLTETQEQDLKEAISNLYDVVKSIK